MAWPATLTMATTTTASSQLASQTLMNGWNMPISSADPLTILQVCHVISCLPGSCFLMRVWIHFT